MIEGGDLLRVGRRLLVGLSSRTNAAGIRALEEIVSPFGYEILPIPVHGCLHLKTACTALPDHSLLINPDWLDVAALQGFQCRSILPSEPWAANVALVNGHVIAAANQQASIDQLIDLGFQVHPVDISEFQKAEGGVTCLSLLLSQHRSL
jgi:dimethylargininase